MGAILDNFIEPLYLDFEMPGFARIARGGWPDVIGFVGRMFARQLAGCHRIRWPDVFAAAGRMRPD